VNRNPLGVETKVAYPTAAGLAVTAVYTAATTYGWFTPPPPDVTAAGLTVLWAVIGYFAKHTSRTTAPADEQLAAFAEATGVSVDDYKAALKHATAERMAVVQGGGTGTGPAEGDTGSAGGTS
jgi:hypothetical protein